MQPENLAQLQAPARLAALLTLAGLLVPTHPVALAVPVLLEALEALVRLAVPVPLGALEVLDLLVFLEGLEVLQNLAVRDLPCRLYVLVVLPPIEWQPWLKARWKPELL